MKTLYVHDWDKWQTYRRDRGAPPWIKIHRTLMRSRKWIELSDVQRSHLVHIWMLAADEDGRIPNDPHLIRKFCQLDTEPDLNLLIEKGFLDAKATSLRRRRVVKATSARRSDDAPEAETEAETKAEAETEGTFAYKGGFVKRVTEKSLLELQALCPQMTRTDIVTELGRCDAYYSEQETPPKSWWWTTRRWFERINEPRKEAQGVYKPNPALRGVL
jgi:hypothetical protein